MVTKKQLLRRIQELEDKIAKMDIILTQATSIAGFNRQNKKEDITPEQIMDEWFNGKQNKEVKS